jgi:hypothetical protein
MITHPKWVLQGKKSAARIFLGEYFSSQAVDFASPHFYESADAGQ